ncbi:nucleotidyltransferase [Dysgonomonas sp. ZJ279]|uniref:nucleotidyltransferase n=1 Tax=Dysgonomonas sp. ZJ279 TaxID=2709796 RepID=UPI0013E9CC72|nr:nucleotidyltransferase [Dysgonomonas sp. ZJ279]
MTIAEIKQIITDFFVTDETVIEKYALRSDKTYDEQFSSVSLEDRFFSIVAMCVWSLVKLFDRHRIEVNEIIANLKPHTARWYANKSKDFQFGDTLPPDSDTYDNTDRTPEEIAASRIVSYSAVVERDNKVVIKVAKDKGNDLAELDNIELPAFKEFIARVKDAGVAVEIISAPADQLKLSLDIYYDPLILNAQGQRLDGVSTTPVADGLRAYLRVLPFNGQLVMAFVVDALQQIDGVVIPHIVSAAYKYGDLDWLNISVKYQPYAGYLRIADADLTINYIPQTQLV